MRLVVFGRVVRSCARESVCTVDKYEFRTQSRAPRPVVVVHTDCTLRRWADTIRKESSKAASA